jgi:hypothetical protein
MFAARLPCYRLSCCTRTGLQHIAAAWSDKRVIERVISVSHTSRCERLQLSVPKATCFPSCGLLFCDERCKES